MINFLWLELPTSRINFHGPKDVQAIEVLLYLKNVSKEVMRNNDQTNATYELIDARKRKNCNRAAALELLN